MVLQFEYCYFHPGIVGMGSAALEKNSRVQIFTAVLQNSFLSSGGET